MLFERLQSRLPDALSRQPLNLDFLEFVCESELNLIESFADQVFVNNDIVQQLNNLLHLVQGAMTEGAAVSHIEEVVGSRGRPTLVIEKQRLEFLLGSQFSVPFIADLLGVSTRTIFRRMQKYGLSVSAGYSTMTDAELDTMVRTVKQQFPNAGYRNVKGQLMARGSRVQWDRIKASMHRVDAAGVLTRLFQLGCVARRSYSVPGPLALVHVDTNHKLIRHFLYLLIFLPALKSYNFFCACISVHICKKTLLCL